MTPLVSKQVSENLVKIRLIARDIAYVRMGEGGWAALRRGKVFQLFFTKNSLP